MIDILFPVVFSVPNSAVVTINMPILKTPISEGQDMYNPGVSKFFQERAR